MATDYDDESEGETSLVEFEERISLASTADVDDGQGESITMMTVHAAKGLEFPVVFVTGMEDGLFPSLRERDYSGESRDSLEEERRLAYVAFTRAMDRLVLTSARTRRVWNEIRMNHPSRFLDEIPAECVAVRQREQQPGGVEVHADFEPDFEYEQHAPRRTAGKRARRKQSVPVDDFDQRTYWDDVPDFDVGSDGGAAASVGGWVRHSSFGPGQVLEARGEGRDRKLLINFESVGLKTILARFVDL